MSEESAPHSLEEKLAQHERGDAVARRTRKSILASRFGRQLGTRNGRIVLLNDTGMTRSFWVSTSDSDQEKPATLYERTRLNVREHAAWMMEVPNAGDV